jgi:hypothetical protein
MLDLQNITDEEKQMYRVMIIALGLKSLYDDRKKGENFFE